MEDPGEINMIVDLVTEVHQTTDIEVHQMTGIEVEVEIETVHMGAEDVTIAETAIEAEAEVREEKAVEAEIEIMTGIKIEITTAEVEIVATIAEAEIETMTEVGVEIGAEIEAMTADTEVNLVTEVVTGQEVTVMGEIEVQMVQGVYPDHNKKILKKATAMFAINLDIKQETAQM